MVIRLLEGEGLHKRWVPLEEIAPVAAAGGGRGRGQPLLRALPASTGRSSKGRSTRLLAGGRARGASTITMQTAKNLFLWPGRDFRAQGAGSLAHAADRAALAEAADHRGLSQRRRARAGDLRRRGRRARLLRQAGGRARRASEAALLAAVLPSPRELVARAVRPNTSSAARARSAPGSASSARCSTACGPPEPSGHRHHRRRGCRASAPIEPSVAAGQRVVGGLGRLELRPGLAAVR